MTNKKSAAYDQPSKLMRRTMELIEETGIQETSQITGLPFPWLQKFTLGAYKNPSVNRVAYAFEKLTNSHLV